MKDSDNFVPVLIGLAMVWLGGYLVGRSHKPKQKKIKIDPGTYVDGEMTASVLMSVGMKALVDGLYDEYELEDILSNSNI